MPMSDKMKNLKKRLSTLEHNVKNRNQPSDVEQGGYHGPIVPDTIHQQKEKQAQGNGLIANDSFLGKLINQFKELGTGVDNSAYTENHFDKTMIDMLGYKRLTNDRHHFLVLANTYKEDNGYAEIIRVGGASLSDLPQRLIKLVLARFIGFLRSFLVDIEFVSIPLPNNSKPQQRDWTIELDRVNNELIKSAQSDKTNLTEHRREQLFSRRAAIRESLKQFREVDSNLDNQGFVMLVFDTTEKKLANDVNLAYRFGGQALKLSPMSVHEKEVFLTRLNNPNITE